MANVRLSRAFEEQKNRFLASHSENSRLASAIKGIQRNLEKKEIPADSYLGVIVASIAAGVGEKVDLCCHYFIHPRLEEIAPFYLCLQDEMVENEVNETDFPDVLKAVLKELGWL